MSLNWNWLLLLTGTVLILVEVALGGFAGFDLVLIGSALALGGAIGFLLSNPLAGLVVASILCVAYIVAGRRWVRARVQARHVPSNTDALIGQSGVVIQRLAEHAPGQVKVRDEIWRAVPVPGVHGPFEAGAVVTVASVDGVTLQVR